MDSIIQNIQTFIKEEKQDLNQFEILKIILSKHLISKNKKMKDLNSIEFIQYIDNIRDYINNHYSNTYNELSKEIETYLYNNNALSF